MPDATDNMFKNIIDSVPGLVYQIRFRKDGSAYWTYLSPSGLEMLGLKKDLIGLSDIVENSSEEDRIELLESVSRSIKH